MKKKLKSKKGASISFGLLLFLVCAVISSVILVAGTNAAGRLSSMSTTEQRYYSVISTTNLIKEMLNNKSEQVIKINDDIFLISNGTFEKVTNLKGIDTLSKHLAYKYYNNEEKTQLTLDLEGLVKNNELKAVDITAFFDKSNKKIVIDISCDDYDTNLILSVNEKSFPIEINTNNGITQSEKNIYTWKVAD